MEKQFSEWEAAAALGVPEAVLIRWRELSVGPAGVPGSKAYSRQHLEEYLQGLIAMLNQGHGDEETLARIAEVQTWPNSILGIETVAGIFKCSTRHIENWLAKVPSFPAGFIYSALSLVEFLERQYCSEARKRLAELRASGTLPAEAGADTRPDPAKRKSRVYEGSTA